MQETDIDFDLYRKWIAALRSGKYEQGQKRLRKDDKFCCLGVLCDISGTSTWRNAKECGSTPALQYGNSDRVSPPMELCAKLGLGTNYTDFDGPSYGTDTFWALNDEDNLTFAEIADLIEITLIEAFGYTP